MIAETKREPGDSALAPASPANAEAEPTDDERAAKRKAIVPTTLAADPVSCVAMGPKRPRRALLRLVRSCRATLADLNSLRVLLGGEHGREYELEKSETTIGRASTNDIRVEHDSVSRVHATIVVDGLGVKIRDHDSTNGTWVNDQKITEALLSGGEIIKVGQSAFRYVN